MAGEWVMDGMTPEEFIAKPEIVLAPQDHPAVTWVADEYELIFDDGSRLILPWAWHK